jgi:hypothetical protein
MDHRYILAKGLRLWVLTLEPVENYYLLLVCIEGGNSISNQDPVAVH